MAKITHSRVSTKPANADTSVIDGPSWNGDHDINPSELLSALGISVNADGTVGRAPQRLLFAFRGDSNQVGAGTETDLDDPADQVTTPNSNVIYQSIYANTAVEPITPVNMGTGSLRVRGFTPANGPAIHFGKALNEIINGAGSVPDNLHKLWISEMCISGSLWKQWIPSATDGTSSPLLGGGNFFTASKKQILTVKSVSGRDIAAEIIQLGTNDTSDSGAATNLATNIAAYITQRRADHGSQLLFIVIVMQSTLPNPPSAFLTTARNNELAALGSIPGVALVFAEDVADTDDQVHYVSLGMKQLGVRCAFSYARMAGISERIVTVPTIVGFGTIAYNGSVHGLNGFTGVPGSNIRPAPWQGSKNSDLVLMPCFSGRIGTDTTAIPTPSGWTSVNQGSSVASGITSQFALFSKTIAQSELDGANGFPVSPTITPGGVEFAAKSFTLRGPTTPVIDGTVTPFSHGAFDTSSITAAGVTTSVVGRTVLIVLIGQANADGQMYSAVNANLSNLTKVHDAVYVSSSGGRISITVWQSIFNSAGPTGNTIITGNGVAANACGWTLAF